MLRPRVDKQSSRWNKLPQEIRLQRYWPRKKHTRTETIEHPWGHIPSKNENLLLSIAPSQENQQTRMALTEKPGAKEFQLRPDYSEHRGHVND